MHHQDHQAPSQAGAVRNQGVQAQEPRARPIRQAFVTGATGLLGNLVREAGGARHRVGRWPDPWTRRASSSRICRRCRW